MYVHVHVYCILYFILYIVFYIVYRIFKFLYLIQVCGAVLSRRIMRRKNSIRNISL